MWRAEVVANLVGRDQRIDRGARADLCETRAVAAAADAARISDADGVVVEIPAGEQMRQPACLQYRRAIAQPTQLVDELA